MPKKDYAGLNNIVKDIFQGEGLAAHPEETCGLDDLNTYGYKTPINNNNTFQFEIPIYALELHRNNSSKLHFTIGWENTANTPPTYHQKGFQFFQSGSAVPDYSMVQIDYTSSLGLGALVEACRPCGKDP